MRNVLTISTLLLLLGACTTTDPVKLAAADNDACTAYGFRPGTDAFANCRMQLAAQHRQDNAAESARVGAALSEAGREMQANRPVTCNSSTYGTVSHGPFASYNQSSATTCY